MLVIRLACIRRRILRSRSRHSPPQRWYRAEVTCGAFQGQPTSFPCLVASTIILSSIYQSQQLRVPVSLQVCPANDIDIYVSADQCQASGLNFWCYIESVDGHLKVTKEQGQR